MSLNRKEIETSEMIQAAFDFWFSSREGHLRSPFPEYIRMDLKNQSVQVFEKWLNHLNPEAKDEMNEEIFAERFEEILFETGSKLVRTDDENISILYPFMPRVGDTVKDRTGKIGIIIERNIQKSGDNKFLNVLLENTEDHKQWKTSFELPV